MFLLSPILNIRIDAQTTDPQGRTVNVSPRLVLEKVGPRVPAALFAPRDDGEQQEGVQAVSGHALIDTGASVTCVDRHAAEQAGLPVVDSGPMTSATHEQEIVPCYAGRLRMDGFGEVNFNKAYGANLRPQGLVALIGRDLLASCVLIVNGPEGIVTLSR